MAQKVCPQCGAPIDPTAIECKFCGETLTVPQTVQQLQEQQAYVQQSRQPQAAVQQSGQPQAAVQQTVPQQVYVSGINPSWPVKNKVAAGILGIVLGGIGAHKFYLGKIGTGILYICFCWTGIPAAIGFIEGIIYICSNDENFQLRNHVRIE